MANNVNRCVEINHCYFIRERRTGQSRRRINIISKNLVHTFLDKYKTIWTVTIFVEIVHLFLSETRLIRRVYELAMQYEFWSRIFQVRRPSNEK